MTRHPSIVTWVRGRLVIQPCDCMACEPRPWSLGDAAVFCGAFTVALLALLWWVS